MYTNDFPPMINKEAPLAPIDISAALEQVTSLEGKEIMKKMFIPDYRERPTITDLLDDIERLTTSLYRAANPNTGLSDVDRQRDFSH